MTIFVLLSLLLSWYCGNYGGGEGKHTVKAWELIGMVGDLLIEIKNKIL